MPFNDFTQFPRGRKVISDLNSTPQTIFATNTSFKVVRFAITSTSIGPAEKRRITIRGVSGGATIVIIELQGDTTMSLPGWQTDAAGVEVVTDSATADVDITAFTVEPTIA